MEEYQMSSLIGKIVQLNRGGPESRAGLVIGVGDDYIALSTSNEGIVYYYIEHIKSITLAKNQSPRNATIPASQLEHAMSGSMKDVFQSMKYNQIQINRGGPEKVKGVLTEIYGNYITIVLDGEVLIVIYSHIKNCSFSSVDNSEEEKQEDSQENKGNNKDKSENNKKKSNNNDKQKARSNNRNKSRSNNNRRARISYKRSARFSYKRSARFSYKRSARFVK